MGKTEDPVLAAAYFSAATAATSSGNFSGATAILVVGGTANVICTGMSLSLNAALKSIRLSAQNMRQPPHAAKLQCPVSSAYSLLILHIWNILGMKTEQSITLWRHPSMVI